MKKVISLSSRVLRIPEQPVSVSPKKRTIFTKTTLQNIKRSEISVWRLFQSGNRSSFYSSIEDVLRNRKSESQNIQQECTGQLREREIVPWKQLSYTIRRQDLPNVMLNGSSKMLMPIALNSRRIYPCIRPLFLEAGPLRAVYGKSDGLRRT